MGPNDRLQADLIDFSQNTRSRNKFRLVVTDVLTREVATKALPDKRAETVTIIPDLVQKEGNYVIRATSSGAWRRRCPGAWCTGRRIPATKMPRPW